MRTRLFITSFLTLGLLAGMLLAIFLIILELNHAFNAWLLFSITIAFNILVWLVSPKITDWVQRHFYKAIYYNQKDFTAAYPKYAKFIADLCQKNNTPFPKVGFIDDDNPTAYSYGSGRWNSRLVFTHGVINYLEPNEVEAVLGHEIGHIVHRDFIVMSIANAIIQLLYEIYFVFTRGSGNSRGKGSALVFVGWLAYIFYIVGLYIVLFLNRLREYYADEFSAESTHQPHDLSKALVKIAYGIMAKDDNNSSRRLLESTQTMGIMSVKSAKGAGLVAQVSNMDPVKVARVMLYDIVSPWAKLSQFSATHPLTGKRLLKMEKMAAALGQPVLYDVEAAKAAATYSPGKLWGKFFAGCFMYFTPLIAIIGTIVAAVLLHGHHPNTGATAAIGFGVILAIFLLRIFYRYPSVKNAPETDILDLMSDIYASPVRGHAVQISGEVVGKGVPGYVFSEDMMMQDNSGLMYLDYQGAFPLISNLFFAIKKVKKLLGQKVTAKGWFFRSNTQSLQLKSLKNGDQLVRSYPRLWSIVGAIFFALVLSFLLDIGLSANINAYTINKLKNPTITYPVNSSNNAPQTTLSATGTVNTDCYSIQLPPNTSVTKTPPCDTATIYNAGVDSFDLNISVSLMSPDLFAHQVSVFKASEASRIISDDQITISGVPAERIVYINSTAAQYPSITLFIDSSSPLRSKIGPYYIKIETPYGFDPSLESANSIINNAINSLQIKTFSLPN